MRSDEKKASPGTVALFMSRDSDGDPRWAVHDDGGYKLESGFTMRFIPGAYGRAERRGKRAVERWVKTLRTRSSGATYELTIAPEPVVETPCASEDCERVAVPGDFLCKSCRRKHK